MINSLDDFYTGAAPSITLFNAFVKKHGLVGKALPDHLCYKCGSHETFLKMRPPLESGA